MREIVLDTETTGLEPAQGHRIIEIGCLELNNRTPTGMHFHSYVNPQRDVPEDAQRITNLSTTFLQDKPLFADVVDDLLAFLGDSPLVIHNAEFDLRFLNAEMARLGRTGLSSERAIDTAMMARKRFPGAAASLDALCRRFNISLEKRKSSGHGALLDVELLADVYLELCGGRQPGLDLSAAASRAAENAVHAQIPLRPLPLPSRLSEEDLMRHRAAIATLGPGAIWNA